jgi:hypothetical protein
VALNSPAGWSQVDSLAVSNGKSDKTIRVSIPMSQFNLSVDSNWYQFNLAVSGTWGSSAATIYIDGLRIVDLSASSAADFDGDGAVDGDDLAWWRYGAGFTRHGDADGDGDTDGNDLMIWQRGLGTGGAAAVPEPGSLALAIVLAAAGVGRRRVSNGA